MFLTPCKIRLGFPVSLPTKSNTPLLSGVLSALSLLSELFELAATGLALSESPAVVLIAGRDPGPQCRPPLSIAFRRPVLGSEETSPKPTPSPLMPVPACHSMRAGLRFGCHR